MASIKAPAKKVKAKKAVMGARQSSGPKRGKSGDNDDGNGGVDIVRQSRQKWVRSANGTDRSVVVGQDTDLRR